MDKGAGKKELGEGAKIEQRTMFWKVEDAMGTKHRQITAKDWESCHC